MAATTPPAVGQGKKGPATDMKIATEAEVEQHLALADPSKGGDRAAQVNWFANVYPPNEDVQKRVALKLVDFAMNDASAVVRGRAGAALPNWATTEVGPQLIKLVKGTGPTEKEGAIVAIGRLKYEKGIPTLIFCVEANSHTTKARNALMEMGPACEDAVLDMLKSDRAFLKSEALRILDQVGTKKSLPALEETSKYKEANVARLAKATLQTVQERVNGK